MADSELANLTEETSPAGTVWLYVTDSGGTIDRKVSLTNLLAALTAAELLTRIKTVDGAGSGLDADLLDGTSSAGFATSGHDHSAAYQPLDSDLTSIAALTTTVYGRSLLEAANAAALRTLAGVVIGTDVQAYDADLADLITRWVAASTTGPASLDFAEDTDNGSNRIRLTVPASVATDKTITLPDVTGTVYVTGGDDVAVADGGTGASTAADARTNLGLVIGTNVQAYDAELAALAGLTSAADKLPYFTGSGTADVATLTSFIRTLLDDTDATTARSTLGLVIGTDVQAFSSDLADLVTRWVAASAAGAASLDFLEDADNGTSRARLQAPASLAGDVDITLPSATGTLLTSESAASTYQPLDTDLTAIAALTSAADKLAYATGSGTWGLTDLTSFARTLLDDASAATARATLDAAALGFTGKWPSGSYLMGDAIATTLSMPDQRLFYFPLWVPEARTTSELAIETTGAGVGGTPVVRLGIYSPDADGRPGTLLVDAGTIDVTVAPGVLSKAVSQALTAGLYWFAACAQGATVTQPTLRSTNSMRMRWTNPTTLGAANAHAGYHQNSVSGALPATATPVATVSTNQPIVLPKAA